MPLALVFFVWLVKDNQIAPLPFGAIKRFIGLFD